MALLSFDEIRAKVEAEAKTEDVFVPSLGGDVRLVKLGAQQKISLGLRYQGYLRLPDLTKPMVNGQPQMKLANPSDVAEFQAVVVEYCAVDADGQRMFSNPVGREVLNGIDSTDLMMLANKAITLNGMDKDEPLEDSKKNLNEAAIGSSPLPSAENLDSRTLATSCPA